MYLYVVDAMSYYETKYTNINGNNFENEMSKIMLRYKNEGKPTVIQEEEEEEVPFNERKQVRFEEGSEQLAIGGADMILDNRL